MPLEVPAIVQRGDALVLDTQTSQNLAITSTQRDGAMQGLLRTGVGGEPRVIHD